jgi:hypothetical protein
VSSRARRACCAALLLTGCVADRPEPADDQAGLTTVQAPTGRAVAGVVTVLLTGPVCGECARKLVRAATKMDGVLSAAVDSRAGRLVLFLSTEGPDEDRLAKLVKASGYGFGGLVAGDASAGANR